MYDPAIKDFKYRIPLTGKTHEIAERMGKCNSVGIHIRRGDYVGGSMDLLTREYYLNVMRYMTERVDDPVFFFFSDDPDHVRNEYGNIPCRFEIIDGNKGKDSYFDMQLMSECRHNIICNSSFSLWGAVLNRHKDKIVIRPCVLSDALIPRQEGWYTADLKGQDVKRFEI